NKKMCCQLHDAMQKNNTITICLLLLSVWLGNAQCTNDGGGYFSTSAEPSTTTNVPSTLTKPVDKAPTPAPFPPTSFDESILITHASSTSSEANDGVPFDSAAAATLPPTTESSSSEEETVNKTLVEEVREAIRAIEDKIHNEKVEIGRLAASSVRNPNTDNGHALPIAEGMISHVESALRGFNEIVQVLEKNLALPFHCSPGKTLNGVLPNIGRVVGYINEMLDHAKQFCEDCHGIPSEASQNQDGPQPVEKKRRALKTLTANCQAKLQGAKEDAAGTRWPLRFVHEHPEKIDCKKGKIKEEIDAVLRELKAVQRVLTSTSRHCPTP
ncbi:MAG: hypothetical protein AAFP00_04215, partial [Bacteroidota bacterium]